MSNEPKAGPGLDPELLAAYVDQRLSPEQRAAVEARLAADPDSYAVLVETLKAVDDLKVPGVPGVPEVPGVPKVPTGGVRRVRWAVAGGLLAAAAALLLVVQVQPDWWVRLRGGDPRFERLVAAVGEERYVEPRLTGGFAFGPLRSVTRGAQSPASDNVSILAAAAELQQRAQAEPTTRNLHAWGVAQLLLAQVDEAIVSLTAADSAAKSADRRVLSDLAAAYVTRAVRNNRPDDWPLALASASKAVEGAEAPLPEALFNRALAAESLNLRAAAERYWQEYVAAESESRWRAEGEEHLRRLRESKPQSWKTEKPRILDAAARSDDVQLAAFVMRHAQRIRELVEDELLPAWAAHERDGAAQALDTIVIAERLAEALAAKTHDDLLARSTKMIADGDRGARLRMALAVLDYASGRQLYERAAMQESVTPFSSAALGFRREALPLFEWSQLYVATAAYYGGDYPSALAILKDISQRTSHESWLSLAARVEWLQGLIATQRAEYDRSLRYYTQTLERFERLLESENQAAVHSLIASALLYLGDNDSVWQHTVRSLQTRTVDTPFRRHHMILVGACNRAIRLGLPAAALVFADEAAANHLEWGDPVATIEIANYRARTLLLLGRANDAKLEVERARAALASVVDPGLRRRAEAEVLQSEADVLSVADPRAGVAAATRALEYFESNRSALRIPRLYAARAEARQSIGDRDGATADLREGAARLDIERQTLPRSERLRLSYSDEVWGTYRRLVAAEVDRGAACADILTASERARAVTLTPSSSERTDGGSDPARAIVSFTFIDDRLVIIALRGGRCDLRVVRLTQSSVLEMVRALRDEISARGSAWSAASSSVSGPLFDLLLGPVWPLLTGTRRLDVVADGPVHHLPLAALRLPDGRLLIEAVAIRMLTSLHGTAASSISLRTALVSAGGESQDAGLPPLPGAEPEVARVAHSLRTNGLSIEQAVDGEAFLSALARAEIVHFAGHAVLNEQYPLLSRLMLAGPGDRPWVTAEQIATAGPISARLVFLSACSTQAGRLFGGEGPASLARSFLAAGAHEVVASLWPVADSTAPRMVSAFYDSWVTNRDAAEALQATILADLPVGAIGPQQWAAWTVIGREKNDSDRRTPSP